MRNRILPALISICSCLVLFATGTVGAQGLGGAGTIQGIVKDPTGAVMVAVTVDISNSVSGLQRGTTTDTAGRFVFHNLPPNPYHVAVTAQGFQLLERDVDVRSAVPIDLELSLALATETTTVNVVGHAEQLVERDPTAHTDIDQTLVAKLPLEGSSGLNQVITLASPGVVADSNGFFHPIGDHGQTQFSIDNQPVTDQQSRVYSNQISPDAVASMEAITGVPPAEFGDKDSLVVRIVTKSGLDQPTPTGSVSFGYGSFRSPTVETNIGAGSHTVGNFLSLGGTRTGRYLDSPEFEALHDNGNSLSVFDRLDAHPGSVNAFHLNLQVGRSSFDVPNTFDQQDSGQDQHQTIDSFNLAPGYTRIIGSRALLTANGYARRDHVVFMPSADPFADTPATVAQDRTLTNFGAKVDIDVSRAANNIKLGGTVSTTKLDEDFTLGLTDPGVNDPASDSFLPGLLPFDLTRGGSPFHFAQKGTIKSQAFYIQDNITAGDVTLNLGLRADHYVGLTTNSLVQPRIGVSYAPSGSGAAFRASYGRTMESPYNENLLVSAADVFGQGAAQPTMPGKRDQFEAGYQQSFGRWMVTDFGYFKKKTTNAYDFGVLFDTPIAFPISWDHSNLDGFTGRINFLQHGGFTAFMVMGHTNAIFSLPQNGGLFPEEGGGEFRIDHDQKFQQTTSMQYEFYRPAGAWLALTWRYDSGLVAGSVPDFDTALGLSADQQAAVGLFCGSTFATRDTALTACSSPDRGAARLKIPADGTEDDVTNPSRIAPRHLFDLGVGVDNLFRSDKAKMRVRFSVVNLTNKEALYNFLSTFSGTHFVTPRAFQFQAGVTF